MAQISVKKLAKDDLNKMGVFSWPIWEKEVSRFDWTYDSVEKCYILEGKVTVTPKGGKPVSFGKGDFVTFPSGMKCVWDIKEAVKKHYSFE
ncbi:MAG: cupin domain-containing protein [Candidatus Omnitrophota bacterium]